MYRVIDSATLSDTEIFALQQWARAFSTIPRTYHIIRFFSSSGLIGGLSRDGRKQSGWIRLTEIERHRRVWVINRQQAFVALLSLLFVIGGVIGGGPTSPILSMLVELVACMLGTLAIAGLANGDCTKESVPALIFLAIVCAVPVVQLIPLPAGLFAMLPGRQVPNALLHLIAEDHSPHPLSLDPEQTRLAAFTLVVPAATFVASLQLSAASRDQVMRVIVGFALVSAVLGIFQVAEGGLTLGIYPLVHDGFPIGFFANRNHEADLLLVAIPLSARIIQQQPWRPRSHGIALIGLTAFFVLSVVSTQSRTGMALLPLAIFSAITIVIGTIRDKRVWISGIAVLIFTVIGYVALDYTPIGQRALHRFSNVENDLRPHIWEGTRAAIKNFWPAGTGVGTFPPIYNMFEDLNSVGQAWVNHAHNDYLELLLVAGLPAAILLAAYVVVLAVALFKRVSFPLRTQRYAGLAMLLILLAHSLTDYPLRTFALLFIFAFSSALLYPSREMRGGSKHARHRATRTAFPTDLGHA